MDPTLNSGGRFPPPHNTHRKERIMSENMQCNIYIKNQTGGTISCTNSSIPWGKWTTTPPIQITNNSVGYMCAKGAKGSATGTEGSATYTFSDNATSFTVNFDIPYSGHNSGGGTLGGSGMSQYTAMETDSTYTTQVSFPSGGDAPSVYFLLGLASASVAVSDEKHFDPARKIAFASSAGPVLSSLNIADVAREADCGEISSEELVIIFQGKTDATVLQMLAADRVAPADRVRFVSDRNLIDSARSFKFAVDFAAYVVDVLKSDPEAFNAAEDAITALRRTSQVELLPIANRLEAAKYALLGLRHSQGKDAEITAIEAILACMYMAPGAALLQAGTCARITARDNQGYEAIARWQLEYLQKALAN
jgi:hypothetical protein